MSCPTWNKPSLWQLTSLCTSRHISHIPFATHHIEQSTHTRTTYVSNTINHLYHGLYDNKKYKYWIMLNKYTVNNARITWHTHNPAKLRDNSGYLLLQIQPNPHSFSLFKHRHSVATCCISIVLCFTVNIPSRFSTNWHPLLAKLLRFVHSLLMGQITTLNLIVVI